MTYNEYITARTDWRQKYAKTSQAIRDARKEILDNRHDISAQARAQSKKHYLSLMANAQMKEREALEERKRESLAAIRAAQASEAA